MNKKSFFFAGLIAFVVLSLPAHSQSTDYIEHRLDRLERDIQYVQKNVYSSQQDGQPVSAAGSQGVANLSVQIDALEAEMRTIRGDIETIRFNQRKYIESLERFEQEVDLRFQQLRTQPHHADGAVLPPKVSGSVAPNLPPLKPRVEGIVSYTPNPKEAKDKQFEIEVTDSDTLPALGADDEEKEAAEEELQAEGVQSEVQFQRPREHYNFAFGLIDNKQYDDAIASFSSFIGKYPEEELIGHAYYWLGEAHYAKGNYLSAADVFRQGFEEKTAGPKAPDNLFKLAKSLAKLDKKKEACVVFEQLQKKYDDRSTPVKDKAEEERQALGCDTN